MDFIKGECDGTAIMHFEHHGATITEFGAGESQESPFIISDLFAGHLETHGSCW